VIEILDGNKEDDVMNGYKREEVLVKIKPDQMVGATAELESDTRRSGRIKIANRQFKDYELYTTMEEEEQLMLAKQWKKIQQMMKRMRKFKPLWRILSWFSTKKKKESSTTAARARARTTGILLTSGVPPPPRTNMPRSERLVLIARRKGGSLLPRAVPKRAATGPESEASACCYAHRCKICLQRCRWGCHGI
jgi:hypothetical protein